MSIPLLSSWRDRRAPRPTGRYVVTKIAASCTSIQPLVSRCKTTTKNLLLLQPPLLLFPFSLTCPFFSAFCVILSFLYYTHHACFHTANRRFNLLFQPRAVCFSPPPLPASGHLSLKYQPAIDRNNQKHTRHYGFKYQVRQIACQSSPSQWNKDFQIAELHI